MCGDLYEHALRIAKVQGTRQVAVVVVGGTKSEAPDKNARVALQRLHEDPAGVIYRMAFVHLRRSGFAEASVRSVIVALRRHLTSHDNQKTLPRVEEALAWAMDGLPTAKSSPVDTAFLLDRLNGFNSSPGGID